jgi:hypothetical protein
MVSPPDYTDLTRFIKELLFKGAEQPILIDIIQILDKQNQSKLTLMLMQDDLTFIAYLNLLFKSKSDITSSISAIRFNYWCFLVEDDTDRLKFILVAYLL